MLWRLTRSQGSARPRVLRVPASVSPGHAAPLSRPRRPAAHCTPLCGCATVLSSLPRPEPCPAQPSLPSHARRRPSLSSSRTAPSVQVSRGNAVPALALFLSNQAHPRPKASAWVFLLKYLNGSLSYLFPLLPYMIAWPPL